MPQRPDAIAPRLSRGGSMAAPDLFSKTLDGYVIAVRAMLYGNARVILSLEGTFVIEGGWCYENHDAAVAAAEAWDGTGDPPGPWHRSVMDGRRRSFNAAGEIDREWVHG